MNPINLMVVFVLVINGISLLHQKRNTEAVLLFVMAGMWAIAGFISYRKRFQD